MSQTIDYPTLLFSTISLSHPPLSASKSTLPLPPQTVTLITLNRPSKLNAFTWIMASELVRALSLVSADERVKVVVITGAGTAFCAGADLSLGLNFRAVGWGVLRLRTGRRTIGTSMSCRELGGWVSLAIYRCTKPVIAAINGAAVGIGITMTLTCTIRLAWAGAKIAAPFTRRGVVPEACSSWFLPRLIGHSKALHIFTTGETMRADSRLLDGLFSEVLEKREDVLPRALKLAEMLATETSAVSTYLVKNMIFRAPQTIEETYLLESRLLGELFSSNDCKEGVAHFLEKRPPKFTDTVGSD